MSGPRVALPCGCTAYTDTPGLWFTPCGAFAVAVLAGGRVRVRAHPSGAEGGGSLVKGAKSPTLSRFRL